MGVSECLVKNKKKLIKGAVVLCVLACGGFAIRPVMTMMSNSSALPEDKYIKLLKGKNINSIEVKGDVKSQDDEIGVYADSSNASLKVIKVNCKVGDRVKKGDVLAVLDSTDLKKEIEQKKEEVRLSKSTASSNLKAKQDAYDNLKEQYDNNLIGSINECNKNIEAARIDLEEKKRTYEQNKVLNESKAATDEALAESKAAVENAKNTYDSSIAALESAKKDAQIKLSTAKDELDSAKAANEDKSGDLAVQLKEKRLEYCEIKATIDGTITKVNITEGTPCGTSELFEIQNLDDLIVKAKVKENDIAKVEVDDTAEIKTDSLGEDRLTGKVYDIAKAANSKDDDPFSLKDEDNEDEAEFQVKIRFDDKDERIMNGMNAIIDIIVDEKDDVYTVPSACIFKEDDNDYIYAAVKKDGKHVVTKIPVTKGTESDTNVEINGDDLDDNMIVLNTPADYDEGKIINIKE